MQLHHDMIPSVFYKHDLRDRQRELAHSPPNVLNGQGLARPNPGAGNSILVSHVGGRDQTLGPPPAGSQSAHEQEAGVRSRLDSSPGAPTGDAGGLTARLRACVPPSWTGLAGGQLWERPWVGGASGDCSLDFEEFTLKQPSEVWAADASGVHVPNGSNETQEVS